MYRDNAYIPDPPEKPKKKTSTITYVIACAACVSGAGLSAQVLSMNLPEDHVSCGGFFTAIGFLVVALYFGFRAAD